MSDRSGRFFTKEVIVSFWKERYHLQFYRSGTFGRVFNIGLSGRVWAIITGGLAATIVITALEIAGVL